MVSSVSACSAELVNFRYTALSCGTGSLARSAATSSGKKRRREKRLTVDSAQVGLIGDRPFDMQHGKCDRHWDCHGKERALRFSCLVAFSLETWVTGMKAVFVHPSDDAIRR